MSKLDSITLSNLRKFGQQVNIQLSSGATILLAPNGTGKTTVFEAIEFGLTGKVARLQDLTHIIRDDQVQAAVRLSFGNQTVTAQVSAKGEVSREGDLSSIFPNVSAADIPFLLRLTHLLDQRENAWIVNAEERDAGSQLAKLPIGRDGSKARTTLPSVRRSLTDLRGREEEILIGFQTELNEWNSKLQERDVAATGATGALRPRDQIAQTLSEMATQAQCLDQIPAHLLNQPVSQESLAIAHATLAGILNGKAEQTRSQIAALPLADDFVVDFGATQALLEKLNADLIAAKQTLGDQENIRSQAAVSLQEHQENTLAARQQLNEIVLQLERLIRDAATRQEFGHREASLASSGALLADAEKNCRSLLEEHQHNQQIQNQHALIDSQLQVLADSDQRLQAGLKLANEWQTAEQQHREVLEQIELYESIVEGLSQDLNEKVSATESSKAAHTAAQTLYNSLSSSTDAIRQAVASIAQHLPSDQGDCPVCLEPHGAATLKARVNQALHAINPNLNAAEEGLRIANEAREVSEAAVQAAQELLDVGQSELEGLVARRQALERQISLFRTDPVLANDSLQLARESIRQQMDAIAASRQRLGEQRAASDPLPTPEALAQTKQVYEDSVRALDGARAQHIDATTRLDQAVAALAAINSEQPVATSLELLTSSKAEVEQRLVEFNGKVGAAQAMLDIQQRQLAETTTIVQSLEQQVRETQARLSQLRVGWQQMSLLGDPLPETIQARNTSLLAVLNSLDAWTAILEGVNVEISSWAKLGESQLAQRLIDAQRLDRTEEAFTAHLNDSIQKVRANLSRLIQLSEGLELLDGSLKKEIDNVQKHVGKVVPRWQGLLRRVVRDARFHEASLKFFNLYNKDRAGVSVPVGSKPVPVSDVASEAQLTDLQLTFLLSMAMSHPWSPWKALLLDDPTQHHDLVHASAVFDLLRDYIIDHGFQVVIATHDALQARYFLRKLQNDGIEARIWTLAPTENGVTAELADRHQQNQ